MYDKPSAFYLIPFTFQDVYKLHIVVYCFFNLTENTIAMANATIPAGNKETGKPSLSFGQIWNMCFGFLGIQFGWGLQMANMSAIFEHLGATKVAGLWLAAPLTGLLVQPIVGYLSDRTWHPRLGRRRPYFLVGAILSSAALILMPNSSALWMAAGLLWVLDASINISMEPFRAFVADKLPERQRTLGFTTQSFFIGVGAVLASMMPYMLTNWFGVENEAEGNAIPTSVRISFYIGAAAFFTAVLYTILTTKEYPPDPAQQQEIKNNKGFIAGFREITGSIAHMPKIMRQLAPVQFFTWMGLFCMWIFFGVTIARSVFGYQDQSPQTDLGFEAVKTAAFAQLEKNTGINSGQGKKELAKYFNTPGQSFPAGVGISTTTLFQNFRQIRADNPTAFNSLDEKIKTIKNTDGQSADWTIMENFITGKAASADLFIEEYRSNKKKYNDGVEWGGNCFAFYSVITFLVAFLLPRVAYRIGLKRTHFMCLVAGGIGLLAIWIIQNKYALFLSMTGVGIAWASILSMPYAMLSNRIPAEKMGIYMGIFNFFIVIPEIITALSFDWILENIFDWNRTIFVATGGALLLLASLLCLRVSESK